jgi:hypothetical protein
MSYFTASVPRKFRNVSKLGLSLHQSESESESEENAVMIQKVSPVFQKKTALVAGLRVLHINSTAITSLEQANQILQEIPLHHELLIQVQAKVVTAKKSTSAKRINFLSSSSEKVGLSILQDPKTSKILIVKVDPNGMFPSLQVNSILHAVNGQVLTSFNKALELLQQNKTLTLVVLETEDDEEREVSEQAVEGSPGQAAESQKEAVHEETPEALPSTPAILEVIQSVDVSNGSTTPSPSQASDQESPQAVQHESPEALPSTPAIVEVIQTVDVSNGTTTPIPPQASDQEPPQAVQHENPEALSSTPAIVKVIQTVDVSNGTTTPIPPEASNESIRVVACIIRPSQDMDIGVTLQQDSDSDQLRITSVDNNGLFANTGLQANMSLLKINGHVWSNIRQQKLAKAMELLQKATGRITLEAMTEHFESSERQVFSIQKATPTFSLGL